MTARDELEQDIRSSMPHSKDPESIVHHVAKWLHEDGYRKPRVITTVEELDALPINSVVLSLDGDVWTRIPGGWGLRLTDYPETSETVLWQSTSGPSATVLHDPAASK